MKEQNVPIQVPTFSSVMRFLGLYQNIEGSSRDLERNGRQAHLHRRHSGHRGVGNSFEGLHRGNHLPPGELGIRYTRPQVTVGTNEDNRFSRILSGFHHHGAETSGRQHKEPPVRGKKDSDSRLHNSPGITQPTRQKL